MSPTVREIHEAEIVQIINMVESEDPNPRVTMSLKFLLWGSKTYLQSASDQPSEHDLTDQVTDGADDMGLDLYHIDDDAEVLHLVQSKFRHNSQTVKRQEIDSFLALPSKLMDPSSIASVRNDSLLEFAKDFRDRVARGYEIKLAYLTTERQTEPIRKRVRSWNANPLRLGAIPQASHELMVVDASELLARSVIEDSPIDTSFLLEDCFEGTGNGGGSRYLMGTLSAIELDRLFVEHRYRIFRLNPRGPLGPTNRVNREVKSSLENRTDRGLFHFFNNGLTAVCEAFSVDECTTSETSGYKVNVRDFQIVNGCQTTWTIHIHSLRGGELDGAQLNIKLIEAPRTVDLASRISRASNSQSQMMDWDFLFDMEDQKRLQDEFTKLDPPLFYELKRGEQKYIEQQRGSKKTIKDVAQSVWAFIGHPAEARDRTREIARNTDPATGPYKQVFFEGVTARHLVLPIKVHERVNGRWKEETVDEPSGRRVDDRRLHILWLIGEMILGATMISRYDQIDTKDLATISNRLEDWFTPAYDVANRAITDTQTYFTREESADPKSLRQVYRSTECYERFKQDLQFCLSRETSGFLRDLMLGG